MSNSIVENIYNLIARKLSRQVSESQLGKFEEWRKSSEANEEFYDELKEIWSTIDFSTDTTKLVSQDEENEKIWQKTLSFEKKARSLDGFKLLQIAAVLVIFISVPYVTYTLSDFARKELPEISTVSKETRPGQKSTITLQDGTMVYLNSKSKISYKSDYNDSLRIIELDGQAFFDVFKNAQKPFIVKCRALEVEALGTSFDVNAYRDEPIQVSLVTGSVRLSVVSSGDKEERIINPGEFSIVSLDNEFVGYGAFDPYEILAWKEGRLIFRNQTITEIIPKLELWYGVRIQYKNSDNLNKPFTGTFERENLYNILMNLGGPLDFDYIIDGNSVTITKKNMPM